MTLAVRVSLLALVIVALLMLMGVEHGWAASCGGEQGIASWYSYTGHRTASGTRYTGHDMTAAHRSLPFGARVRVSDLRTRRSVVVRIDDRGPWVRGRVIDLSPRARQALGMDGLARVCLTVLR